MGVNAPTHDDDLYQSYLRVLDFISGMTDDYATFISRQFSGTARLTRQARRESGRAFSRSERA